jgi:hypothetical protein
MIASPAHTRAGQSGVRIDWSEYVRVHADRTNLLLHLFAVPLFAGSFIVMVGYGVRGDWISVLAVAAVAIVAMALQGRGHRTELETPRPFTGPANFVSRWFAEQFFIFPAFVLTGRWWRQYRTACGK